MSNKPKDIDRALAAIKAGGRPFVLRMALADVINRDATSLLTPRWQKEPKEPTNDVESPPESD